MRLNVFEFIFGFPFIFSLNSCTAITVFGCLWGPHSPPTRIVVLFYFIVMVIFPRVKKIGFVAIKVRLGVKGDADCPEH